MYKQEKEVVETKEEKEEEDKASRRRNSARTVHRIPGMDRQYTLCVLVPAHQYRSYVDEYHQQASQEQQRRQHQPPTYHQHQQQQLQRAVQQQYAREQIYENVVSQYRMRMCYHNDYENDEQIQRFYWEQCYKRDDADTTASSYYYCEYVRTLLPLLSLCYCYCYRYRRSFRLEKSRSGVKHKLCACV